MNENETIEPYRLRKTEIRTLRDLCELIDEVYGIANEAYGNSPRVSHTAWSEQNCHLETSAWAQELFTEDELNRPYNYRYPDDYPYDTIHESDEDERIRKHYCK